MNQVVVDNIEEKPLNHQQRTFARELGIAIASGGRDEQITKAYQAAGYSPNRGNARRLAADPRVKAIADKACAEQLRLAGLHIGYLQAKALELLHASPTGIHRKISEAMKVGLSELAPEARAELDSATWALSEFKIDKDGIITIKLPDKTRIIEMLAKQMGIGKDESDVNVAVQQNVRFVVEDAPREALDAA